MSVSLSYRRRVRDELARIAPLDAQEQQVLDWAVDWVMTAPEICRRQKPATPPTHLVSYFVLVDGEHVLLVDHINAELWLPTGGHVDPGESPRDTVVREAFEELGFVPTAVGPPLFVTTAETVGKTAGHTDVSLWYVLSADRDNEFRFDVSEFSSVRWFQQKDVPLDRTDPHMARFLSKLAMLQGSVPA